MPLADLPTPLPSKRPVSVADASLRAVLGELAVHLPCGSIRGPLGRVWARCACPVNDGVWQSCPCEDEPVRWEGCDVSRLVDLCLLCARGTAGGTSRWATQGCGFCRGVNEEAARILCGRPVALARHSIRHGAAIRGDARGAELRRQHDALVGFAQASTALGAWFPTEVRRLADTQGWSGDRQVLLRTWQERLPPSEAASLDALCRFTGIDLPALRAATR